MAPGRRRAGRRAGLVATLPTLALATVLCTALGTALGSAAPASAAIGSTAHTGAVPLARGSRQAVTAAYRAQWQPATTSIVKVSGGDPNRCTPFRTAAATQARTRDAINFARELTGLRPLRTVTDTHTGAAGLSALLQALSGTLSHTPPTSWLCWTLGAATAAGHSNLDLRWSTADGFLPSVADIVGDYLVDRGSTNTEVGHRRWLLRPATTAMGSGNAVVSRNGATYVANDLWVLPSLTSAPPAGTPAFYGWPSAGWFPSPLEPEGRWSLSSSTGGSFAHASVRVTHDGVAVPVTVERTANGYGDNTLVWELASPQAATGRAAQTYDVTVSGITGARRTTYSYVVRLFDPTWTDPTWPSLVSAPSVTSVASTSAPLATTVHLRAASHRVRRHQPVRLVVAVAGRGTPTGRVAVRVDGRRVGSWQLRQGRRSIRLPGIARRGQHQVVVRYAGSAHWRPAAARTAVRVR